MPKQIPEPQQHSPATAFNSSTCRLTRYFAVVGDVCDVDHVLGSEAEAASNLTSELVEDDQVTRIVVDWRRCGIGDPSVKGCGRIDQRFEVLSRLIDQAWPVERLGGQHADRTPLLDGGEFHGTDTNLPPAVRHTGDHPAQP
ncbi:hypothetical protein [Nonomuraea sp. NPDC049480]|uniref:hypothetical protein n=1 Tax=Nonomuraea sp. NPDC049480 TaxID=3364353 RepID=UPI003789DBEE